MKPSDDVKQETPAVRRQHVIIRLIILFGRIAALGSVVSLFAQWHWIPDMLSNLRVQFAALLIPAFAYSCYLSHWRSVVINGVLLFVNLYWIAPYFVPETATERSIHNSKQSTVAIFNVLRTNEDLDGTLATILNQQVDILFLMEVQLRWELYFEKIKDVYPHQVVVASPDYTGVALLSKYPIRESKVHTLGYISNPSIDAIVELPGKSPTLLHLIATHPLPPFGHDLTQSRDFQLKTLSQHLKPDQASLLIGDLNLSPWSPRFKSFLNKARLTDCAKGYGISPTLVPLPTLLGGVQVDHILRNDRIDRLRYETIKIKQSDHAMVKVTFATRGSTPNDSEPK